MRNWHHLLTAMAATPLRDRDVIVFIESVAGRVCRPDPLVWRTTEALAAKLCAINNWHTRQAAHPRTRSLYRPFHPKRRTRMAGK